VRPAHAVARTVRARPPAVGRAGFAVVFTAGEGAAATALADVVATDRAVTILGS